uniref:Dihydropteroate synthase-like protein n=1 Tax=Ignisphaera aggregans TaxID=334771 RepID=A0A7C4FBJ2_9CREN
MLEGVAKVLIVTGRLAEPIIRKILAEVKTEHKVDVIVTPVQVAAFLTAEYVAEHLKQCNVRDYDYILLPGLVRGSGRIVEEATGVKTVKGTVNAYDLVEILTLSDLSILSPDVPADEVLGNIIEEKNREILKRVEGMLASENSVAVGKIRVPLNPPPIRVAVEISEAHTLNTERLVKEATRYVESGADVIVLGFEALYSHAQKVFDVVKVLKREVDVPIAVDTSIPSEINVALQAGADMVINVDLTNIDKVMHVDREVAVVTIPRDPVTNTIPKEPQARVEILEKAVNTIKSKGFEKVFADAILEPFCQTFSSLLAYHMFKQRNPRVPLFAGVGNVTELADVDSVGVNASLVMLLQEIGVSMVLVVEKSVKTMGSTLEAKIASQMATLAYYKSSPPKNLGISLLMLKDKKRYDEETDEEYDTVIYAVGEEKPYTLDPVGVFKIRVNHKLECIEALYIGRKGRILIRGRSARAIQHEILERGLVSQLSHAMYLGRELAKAEIALQLGKNYVQEKPLFSKPKYIKI